MDSDLMTLIKMSGYSVAGLASELDVSRDALYKLIRGESKPSYDLFVAIADRLNVSLDDLRVYLDKG